MAGQQNAGDEATVEPKYIEKIKLHNFKRFKELSIDLDKDLNLLVGDNDSGKSSILLAIELTLGGNRNRVENLTLESLFNTQVVEELLAKEKMTGSFLHYQKCM